MAKAVYQSMFVFLSVLLLALLFIVSPTKDKDLLVFQQEIRSQFAQATVDVLGGIDYAEPFVLVWESVDAFYKESAAQTIALLEPTESVTEMVLMFSEEYLIDKEIASTTLVLRPTIKEDAIFNIVPMSEADLLLDPYFHEDLVYMEEYGGVVAGESISVSEEARPEADWKTITDSITGYPFCLAIFNGEVNSYPGPCAQEDAINVVQTN
jgi:hypothetical protein